MKRLFKKGDVVKNIDESFTVLVTENQELSYCFAGTVNTSSGRFMIGHISTGWNREKFIEDENSTSNILKSINQILDDKEYPYIIEQLTLAC